MEFFGDLKKIFKYDILKKIIPWVEKTLWKKKKKGNLKVLTVTTSFLTILNSSCKSTIFVQTKAHVLFK